MKMLRRQEGYTLLLVLVLVVLLLVVTASFTVASINQSKQIKNTSTTSVSYSVAEMGAEYIEAKTSEIIIRHQQTLKRDVESIDKNLTRIQFDNKVEQSITKHELATAKEIIELLRTLDTDVDSNSYHTSTSVDSTYSLQNEVANFISSKKKVVTVYGTSLIGDSSKENSIDLTINLPDNLGISYSITTTTAGTPVVSITFNEFMCGTNFACSNSELKFANNTAPHTRDILSTKAISFEKLGDRNNKKKGDLDGTNLAKNTITVLSEKSITFNHNQSYVYNANVVTNILNFTSNSSAVKTYFTNSKILVKDIFIQKPKNKVIALNNSTMCVFNSSWDPTNNYILENNSKLLIFNPAKYKSNQSYSGPVYLDEARFETACSVSITSEYASSSQSITITPLEWASLTKIKYN